MTTLLHYFMLALRSIATSFSSDEPSGVDFAVSKNSSNLASAVEGIHVSPKFMRVTNQPVHEQTPTEHTGTSGSNVSNKLLDLAFIMDSTGSMSPYIHNVKTHITSLVHELAENSHSDIRLALVEYRDHPPEDSTFVTREHDFTGSVTTMENWLQTAHASGGGDSPEAVADALHLVSKLSWRKDSAKISVLISDAPPHGLVPQEDGSFPGGCPLEHDPIRIAHEIAKKEITLYSVGCEPSIYPYREFFVALAYITGGQYIPLSDSRRLIDAIIGGAQEELSLLKFSTYVEQEIERVQGTGGVVDEQQIAETVYQRLKTEGAKSMQLLRNNETLEAASEEAKTVATANSMADVREVFEKGESPEFRGTGRASFMEVAGGRPVPFGARHAYEEERYMETAGKRGSVSSDERNMYDEEVGGDGHYAYAYMPVDSSLFGSDDGYADGTADETYTAVESGISYEQISRLVKKKKAKLSRTDKVA